jgi:two-component sensor histidine kinase
MQNIQEKHSLQPLVEVLNRKSNELRLLYETSRFFSSTLDINILYDKLFDVLFNIVDFQDMFVASFNEKERKIKYIYLRSILEEERIDVSVIPEIPLAPEGRGIISESIRKNDTVVVHDYQKRLQTAVKYHVTNEGSLSDVEHEKEYKIESALIVPIKLNGRILGFITIMSKNKNEFNKENLHWIETVVNQAAIANKNAILFSESKSGSSEETLETRVNKIQEEKNILQNEVVNRVKENLRMFSTLLQFQSDYVKDPVYQEYFKVSMTRAYAMSLIQEKLYVQNDLSQIDFENYLYLLVPYLYNTYDISMNRVSTYLNVKNVSLPVDKAITCALIINELMCNFLLHSFPNKKKGNITIDMMEESPGKYCLSVRDNGAGVISAKGRPNSFSMVLVGILVKNLKGSFEIIRKTGNKVTIRF